MTPATTTRVKTYGNAWNSTAVDSEKAGSRWASAVEKPNRQRAGQRAPRSPAAEDHRGERDEAAARGHALVERAEQRDRQVHAAGRRERAGGDRPRDSACGAPAARGCRRRAASRRPSAAAGRRACGTGNSVRIGTSSSATQVRTFSRPIASPMNGMSSTSGSVTFGSARDVGGRALVAVVVDEDVAGDADREEVDPGAAHHLVGAQADRDERVDEAHERARRDADTGSPGTRSRAGRRRRSRRRRRSASCPRGRC